MADVEHEQQQEVEQRCFANRVEVRVQVDPHLGQQLFCRVFVAKLVALKHSEVPQILHHLFELILGQHFGRNAFYFRDGALQFFLQFGVSYLQLSGRWLHTRLLTLACFSLLGYSRRFRRRKVMSLLHWLSRMGSQVEIRRSFSVLLLICKSCRLNLLTHILLMLSVLNFT